MFIAIQLEKFVLTTDKSIFLPLDIIKGVYDKELNVFESTDGEEYESPENCYQICINYFCKPILLEKLQGNMII